MLFATPRVDRNGVDGDWEDAAAGLLEGLAIIEDPEATILGLPGDRLSVSERGDVIIDINVKDNG